MARPFDAGIVDALGCVSAVVAGSGGARWNLSLAEGLVPARARVQNGWFEVSAALPEAVLPEYDDRWGARANSRLDGPARVVRAWGEAPCVKADVCIEDDEREFDGVRAACLDVTRAVTTLAGPLPEFQRCTTRRDADLAADIERACSEAGWRVAAADGAMPGVEISTRGGLYKARIEAAESGERRLVVELADLSGQSAASTDAVSTLLMAVSASVQSVRGFIQDRDGVQSAAVAAPLETLDNLERALSALSVACTLCGREAVALRDPLLASQYLTLSDDQSSFQFSVVSCQLSH